MNEDVINRLCVRITLHIDEKNVNHGTGTLVKGKDCFYVITAHHCIYGDKNAYPNIQLSQIILQQQMAFNAAFENLEVLEITGSSFPDDWAVIKVGFVDKDGQFPRLTTTFNFKRNDEILFTGFQYLNKNESRSFKSTVQNGIAGSEFRITLAERDTFKAGSDDAKGLSGSGAFLINGSEYLLIGILKNVKGDEALNDDIKCCCMKDIVPLIGLEIYEELKKIEISKNIDPRVILFNNYTLKCDLFYYQREIDKNFMNSLKVNNIWLSGNSGKGKTALINRNLSINEKEYCFCDMSPINIESSAEILEEILIKIEDKFGTFRSDHTNKIKQISHLLSLSNKKEVIIVIDELFIDDENILKDIANNLNSLVIYYSNSNPEGNLKFIVSTLFNPQKLFKNSKKASDYFQYLNCDDWKLDIENLFDILNNSLNLNISDKQKMAILEHGENSPRILKAIFRKIISFSEINEVNIEKAIQLTKNEFV
ncbi:hypothetical protein SD427_18180 [Chryseobacterium sp. JJR-5R]|uniref:hypothetical protein n=1 Tax=Chryseobacterium sp. JJR-5R TaxID=3093923 RepID=UPI002A75EC3E|nr:hypothetical protein [Chryseobacterium sp. JJR-5R]WPO82666.1 hypothetical protein SD427_18180 [Chryseobacterium sp. JJR-5R]